jgi:poly-gamma-glutamate synthesis protein (capsule biosynthesis protein)
MDTININIAGDLYLGRGIESIARNNPKILFQDELLQLFSDSDFNVINLESPLTNAGVEHKILKDGPNLAASPETIGVLDLLKINLVTLANNHIYDYGDNGLIDTLELCARHNISTVGAGINLSDASTIFIKEINEIKICFLNFAENEESNADEIHGGANPMDIIANTRSLHEAKRRADIVIVIIHGGHELYQYPSPRIVNQYHYYAEEGASLIVAHHSHCISGYEIYKNIPIFYGLGNFLFDNNIDFEGWYSGILLNIQINSKMELAWKLHLYSQCKRILKVELLEGEEKLRTENKIISINRSILNPDELEKNFNILIDTHKNSILSIFSTSNIIKLYYVRAAIRKLGIEKWFIRPQQLITILNYSRCESLKDITFKVIDNYLKKK